MKRKLTLAMLLSLSATSPPALALGLGEVEVHSTLNTPLRASLPLVDTDGLQPGLLNVSVASERAFDTAGLSRTPLAASIDLAVSRRQGRLVLEMRSDRPVREPWLDLLLRFDWPSGQQLHEVTLLLDPPNYDRMPALVAGSGPSRATATPAPTSSASLRESTPASTAQGEATGDRRGPAWVGSGDTLWAVAGRLQPDSGISRSQVMVALVEANPDVFPSNNINAMRAGHTLTVPSREAMAARSDDQADRIVRAMNQAWASRGSGAPAPVALGTQQTSATASTDAAESGPDDSSRPAQAMEQTGSRLTLLTDAEVAAEQAGTTSEAPASGQGTASVDAPAPAGRVAVDPDVLAAMFGTDGQAGRDERLAQLESRWRESQQALEQVRRERAELETQLDALRAQLDAVQDRLAGSGEGRGDGMPAAGGSASSSDAPWWRTLYHVALERSLMLGGAVLAALLALWAWIRHRRRHEETEPSTFGRVQVVGAGPAEMLTPTPAASPSDPDEEATVRSAMPQAEAINEADIFIAYGRYDQARDLLETNLEREPERDDLRLKLLTVLLETGHHQQAARQAELLRGSDDPAVVAEVARRLQAAGVSDETESVPPQDAGPAVFAEPEAQPPRRFDTAGDDDTKRSGETPASPETTQATQAPGDGEAAAFTSTPEDADPRDDEVESALSLEQAGETAMAPPPDGDAAGASSGERAPLSPRDTTARVADNEPFEGPANAPLSDLAPPSRRAAEDEAPAMATRKDDQGRDVIDYQPPALEPSPAAREETPMQPSVEFTPSGDGESLSASEDEPLSAGEENASDAAGTTDLSAEWEVEEVAFPPLDRDNGVSFAGASASVSLAEARRLLEAGDTVRACALLEEVADSGDTASRKEAQALLTRYDA